jgi:hypothetical protein
MACQAAHLCNFENKTVTQTSIMVYKFSDFLVLNYRELEKYLEINEELTKNELLQKCTGEISYDLLQSIKELVFIKIGKNTKGELFIV